MNIPSKGEMKESVNRAPGVSVRPIELGELVNYQDKIRTLQNNVINQKLNQRNEGSFLQRKEALKETREQMKEAGERDLVLVAESGDGKLEGFISIRKEGGVARVEQFWVAPADYGQKGVIGKLIDEALFHLQNGPVQYPKLHIHAPAPSSDFTTICTESERARQLVMDEHANDNYPQSSAPKTSEVA